MRGTPIRAIVLILLLAAACAQCVAQCADSGRGVPPCHRQQQSKSPTLCQIPVLVVKDTPAQTPVDLAAESIALAPVWRVCDTVAREAAAPESAPPLSSCVLRI